MFSKNDVKEDMYGYADVGSYGLAHSLLAWARCVLWCKENRLAIIAPSWLHLQHRIGLLLRRERDNRQYHRLFSFQGYISGCRRSWLLKTRKKWCAETEDTSQLLRSGVGGVVVFRNKEVMNEETHFKDVVGHGYQLQQALYQMTRPRFRPPAQFKPHIAIHVRMGDFRNAESTDELRRGVKNSRLPISWYKGILEGLWLRVGFIPAIVYSDGDDTSLGPLIGLPGVSRAPRQPSVTDLLSIARASILISSGSGFSMWGSFLGATPRICFPGQRFVRVLGDPLGIDLEPEVCTPVNLSDEFFKEILTRLRRQV